VFIKKAPDIKYSEITPEKLYLNRRKFIAHSTALAACAFINPLFPEERGGAHRENLLLSQEDRPTPPTTSQSSPKLVIARRGEFKVEDKVTSHEDATGYTNFYEFSTGKRDSKELARDFRTRPWTVTVEGLVKEPKKFEIDELISMFPLEERIYRWRCVEAWSMIIPWVGFPLAELIKKCEPASAAKFVQFTTLYDPDQMPNQRTNVLKWPYVEGLRLDEAMHPLAILAVGMYEDWLLPQNGAPLRLVVPWKYGFKSIKSIVKISFVADMPKSSWTRANPDEYGFYANVNPFVSHPRWSQAKERRIGEDGKRDTIIFNGYEEQVGKLYADMNLKKFY
jgi:sulfoxide reductase catalytic subunit YedY